MPRLTLLLLLVISCSCRSYGQISVQATGELVRAPDGFELTALVMSAKGPGGADFDAAPAVLFFVAGSEYVSVTELAPKLASATSAGIPVVCVERRGVTPDGQVDADLADRSSTLEQRVADHLCVLRHFLARIPPATPVILAGSSEGATVAGRVAVDDPRVTHLMILAGGGWSQSRELRQLVLHPRRPLGSMSPAVLEQGMAAVRAAPDTLDSWLGHPHLRWSSFLWHAPLDDLVRLEIPILVVHGTEDTNAPIESARAVRDGFLERGKDNLTYVELDGLDHGWKEADTGLPSYPLLELAMIGFLAEAGIFTPAAAHAFELRTRANHPEIFARPPR